MISYDKIHIVYLITRDDGKQYVGTSYISEKSDGYSKRITAHRKTDRFKKHSINCRILYVSFDYKEILRYEKEEIETRDTFYNGLNKSIDGSGNHNSPKFSTNGYKFSKDSRKRMSESAKKRCMEGRNPIVNRKITEDEKRRMSISKKGKVTSFKLSRNTLMEIYELYKTKPSLECVGKIQRNGKVMPYDRAFCMSIASKYNVTYNAILRYFRNDILWKN